MGRDAVLQEDERSKKREDIGLQHRGQGYRSIAGGLHRHDPPKVGEAQIPPDQSIAAVCQTEGRSERRYNEKKQLPRHEPAKNASVLEGEVEPDGRAAAEEEIIDRREGLLERGVPGQELDQIADKKAHLQVIEEPEPGKAMVGMPHPRQEIGECRAEEGKGENG